MFSLDIPKFSDIGRGRKHHFASFSVPLLMFNSARKHKFQKLSITNQSRAQIKMMLPFMMYYLEQSI